MSQVSPTPLDRKKLRFRCHFCSAAPQMWCIKQGGPLVGQPAGMLHTDRTDQLNLTEGRWAPARVYVEIK